MAGLLNTRELVDAEIVDGAVRFASWHKVPTQATAIGFWFDLSMSPGNPGPQYYAAAPLAAVAMARSVQGGLDHGGNVAPASKYLRKMMAMCVTVAPTPMVMIVCDYLLYYPFIDEGTTDQQDLDNTVTLPRYTTGVGVQMMAVAVAAQVGGVTFLVSYTNSAGVAGRTSQTVRMNTQGVTGTLITTGRTSSLGPFIPLQAGDIGVRSIESVTLISGTDVGLFTLVLVKPLAQLSVRGIDAPVEVDYFKDFSQVPQIVDDAYLNLIVHPSGTLAAAAIRGTIESVWK